MNSNFNIKILPIPYYCKYASSKETLCEIVVEVNREGENHTFYSEFSDKCIEKLLSRIDQFLVGKHIEEQEMFFDAPMRTYIWPISFLIDIANDMWVFRIQGDQDGEEVDFSYQMDRMEILSMREQLVEQNSHMDWESIGKITYYTFFRPDIDFDWCYSAKELEEQLVKLCVGQKIQGIYVSGTNYNEPLTVHKNYVNYYVGSEIMIRLDDYFLNLQVHAEGLFQIRVFSKAQVIIRSTYGYICGSDNEFCDITDVYEMFDLEYRNSPIQRMSVDSTEEFPWQPKGFDETRLGKTVDLPDSVHILLANENKLTIQGLMDDFAISIT